MVPVGKLSDRDRLILDGMRQGKYRTYPIRKGEKLEEVLSKRGISMEEFKKLNPDVNPKKVPGCFPRTCAFKVDAVHMAGITRVLP